MPYLVWDSPRGRVGKALDRAILVVGRDPVSDLRLDHASVAARHLLVQSEGGLVRVTDLGSEAGTRINGARLVRDLPSTLEEGDLLQVGAVTLTFLAQAPAAPRPQAPPARAARPAPPPAPAPAAREFPWMWVALLLAFFLVALLGALLAVVLGREPVPVAQQPRPEPVVVSRPAPAPAAPEPAPAPAPPPKPEPAPERAPGDALPPQGFAPVEDFPDLLLVGEEFFPARVTDLSNVAVEAYGTDGRLYTIAAGRVRKIEDRAELGRRVALQRRRLEPGDADARLELAAFSVKRFLEEEARTLVREVIALRPDDAAAKAIETLLGTGE